MKTVFVAGPCQPDLFGGETPTMERMELVADAALFRVSFKKHGSVITAHMLATCEDEAVEVFNFEDDIDEDYGIEAIAIRHLETTPYLTIDMVDEFNDNHETRPIDAVSCIELQQQYRAAA